MQGAQRSRWPNIAARCLTALNPTFPKICSLTVGKLGRAGEIQGWRANSENPNIDGHFQAFLPETGSLSADMLHACTDCQSHHQANVKYGA
jgi:hypothetical protein